MTVLALTLAVGHIAYKSKSQPIISLITTEAEFVAATDCANTVLYIRSIMIELGLYQENITIIFEDNAATIEIVNTQLLFSDYLILENFE